MTIYTNPNLILIYGKKRRKGMDLIGIFQIPTIHRLNLLINNCLLIDSSADIQFNIFQVPVKPVSIYDFGLHLIQN